METHWPRNYILKESIGRLEKLRKVQTRALIVCTFAVHAPKCSYIASPPNHIIVNLIFYHLTQKKMEISKHTAQNLNNTFKINSMYAFTLIYQLR